MMKKKREIILISYGIIAFLLLSFLIHLCTEVKIDIFEQRKNGGYSFLTEYANEVVKDDNTPVGLKMDYTFSLNNIPKEGASLMFYTMHQNVEVYMEDELLYKMKPAARNLFGKTPGCTWNHIPVYAGDSGRELTVSLIPAYENVLDYTPDFYFGSRFDIWMSVIKQEFLPMLMSIVAVIAGIVFIAFIIYNRNNSEIDKSLFMLGCFSICIGLWKWSDAKIAVLLCPHSILISNIPFIALLLAVMSFLLYVKELFRDKEYWLWDVPYAAGIVVVLVSIILQVRDIKDLRETLWMNHVVMIMLIAIVMIMIIRESKAGGFNKRLRVMIICTGICLVGMVVDIMFYYFTESTSEMVIGMFGFLSFIIILGVMSMRETKELMEIGLQAKRFERMAYHDQLTGLYNRTAYAEYGKQLEIKTGNCVVVMCDLNNLKQCNDNYGHEKGDEYIKYCADVIKSVFGEIGKCYRLGGDEFCILIEGRPLSVCEQKIGEVQRRIEAYNDTHDNEFRYGMACGCVRFDILLDHDLEDTLRRADKKMYYQKFQMKKTEE